MRVRTWILVALTLLAIALAGAAGWLLGGKRSGFSAAVERATPSVVTLYAAREVSSLVGVGQTALPLGTGFVIDDAGRVLTTDSVVGSAPFVTAELADGRRVRARRVGRDETSNLVLLRLETETAPPALDWGESRTLRPGDWVLAIGAAHGRPGSLSAGVVGANARRPAANRLAHVQTDAAVSRLSTGGPLLDTRGRVVGVVDAALSQDGRAVGVSFALSSDAARPVAVRLAEEAEANGG